MIDLTQIDAIDVHVHAWAPGAAEEDPMLVQATKYFGDVKAPATLDEMANYYRERRMACVVFTVDGKNQTRAHVTNDEVLAFAARNPLVYWRILHRTYSFVNRPSRSFLKKNAHVRIF